MTDTDRREDEVENPKDGAPEAADAAQAAEEAPAAGDEATAEADPGDRLAEAEQKAQENWDQFLRAKAEIDNLRRRAERDVANAHKYALEKFAGELLAVVDSLELGLKAAEGDGENKPEVETVAEGMQLTLKMLAGTLEKFNVKPLDPLNEPFNPDQHEAMTMVPRDDVEPNTVIEVMQKGYSLNDRVIRPAMVVVSQKPA